jgi:hypothetical protein
VVFWCTHSEQSEEVKKEYDTAIELEKNVLPILLDSTPVPTSLSVYQWLDFRAVVGPDHQMVNPQPSPKAESDGCLPSLLKLFRFGIKEKETYSYSLVDPFQLMATELSKEIHNRVGVSDISNQPETPAS